MTQLSEKKCVPCEGNVSAFDYSEIHKYLKKVNDWEVKQNEKKNYYDYFIKYFLHYVLCLYSC